MKNLNRNSLLAALILGGSAAALLAQTRSPSAPTVPPPPPGPSAQPGGVAPGTGNGGCRALNGGCGRGALQGRCPGRGRGRGRGCAQGQGANSRAGRGMNPGWGGGPPAGAGNARGMAITPGGTLTEAEATQVLFMKQEEKLARDVYLTLGAAWSHPTFQNISGAEQRHMDALDRVIAAYQLPDAAPAEVGRFTIPELQKLYDQLVAQGKPSLEAALKVGVLVEETDIADLQKLLDSTSNPTLRRVAGNLQQASRSHLAAFNRSLETPTAMVSGNSPQNGRGYGRRGHRGGRGGW